MNSSTKKSEQEQAQDREIHLVNEWKWVRYTKVRSVNEVQRANIHNQQPTTSSNNKRGNSKHSDLMDFEEWKNWLLLFYFAIATNEQKKWNEIKSNEMEIIKHRNSKNKKKTLYYYVIAIVPIPIKHTRQHDFTSKLKLHGWNQKLCYFIQIFFSRLSLLCYYYYFFFFFVVVVHFVCFIRRCCRCISLFRLYSIP